MSITRLDAAASAAASTLAYAVSAGSDRLLVVLVCGEWDPGLGDDDVTAVDYGGQAMVKVRFDGGFDVTHTIGSSVWYLLDAEIAAAVGTTITPTFSNPANQSDPMIHAASYEGARQDAGVVVEHRGDAVLGASPDPITTLDLRESSGNLIVAGGTIGEPLPEGTVDFWSTPMTEQTDQLSTSAASSYADRLATSEDNQDIELNWVGPVNRQAATSVHFAQVGFVPSCLREASATSQAQTSSSTYELIPGMELTPGGGDYLAWFSGSVIGDGGLPGDIFVAIFVNGVIVPHTERLIHVDSSFEETTFLLAATHALVQPTDGQVVEVRWRQDSITDILINQRTLNLVKLDAADVDEATATVDDTTSSSTYVQVDSMTLTPGAGKYALFFTASAEGNSGNLIEFAVFVNGVIVAHTARRMLNESSIPDNSECFAIACEVNPGDSEVVEIRWRRTTGTATVHERTLSLWRTDEIQEVSATSDTTISSSSFALMSPLTITPSADSYLVIVSGSWESDSTSRSDLEGIIEEAGAEVDHTQRQAGSDGSTEDTPYPWATNGIVNVNGSELVEMHWRRSGSGTATSHERTMLLISCLAVVEKDAADTVDIDLDPELAEVAIMIDPADQLDLDVEEDAELLGLIGPAETLDVDLGELAEIAGEGAAEDQLDVDLGEDAEVLVPVDPDDTVDLDVDELAEVAAAITPDDTLDLNLIEDADLEASVNPQDDVDVDLDEVSELLAAAEPQDTVDVALDEQAQVDVIVEVLDVLDLSLDELAEVVFGVTLIEATDGLDLSLDELAEVVAAIQASDELDITADDVAEVVVSIQTADALDLEIEQTAEIAAIVSAIDGLDVSLDELAEIAAVVEASDVLDLAIDDDGVVAVGITVDDTMDVALDELAELLGLIGVTDTLDVEIQDAAQVLGLISRSDTLDIAIDDAGAVAVQITAQDDVDLAVDDAGAVAVGIVAADTLSLATVEASELLAFIDRADALNIAIVEGAPVIFVQGAADDTLGLEILEAADVQVPISVVDELDIALDDVAQVVVALQASDLLDLSIDEQADVAAALDVLDQLDLDLTEQADVAIMVDVLDQLDVAIDDVSDLVVALQVADELDISIDDVAQVLRAIAALDSLGLAIDDAAAVEVLAPFEGIIVQPFTLAVCREVRFELPVCREVRFTLQIEGSGVQNP